MYIIVYFLIGMLVFYIYDFLNRRRKENKIKARIEQLRFIISQEGDVQSVYDLLQTLIRYERYDIIIEAVPYVIEHMEDLKKRSIAYTMLGQALYMKRQFRLSIIELRRAIDDYVANLNAWDLLINAYLEVGDIYEANTRIEEFSETLPEEIVTLKNLLGNVEYVKADYNRASELYCSVIKIDRRNLHAHSQYASCLIKMDRLKEARKQMNYVRKLNPTMYLYRLNEYQQHVNKKKNL